MKQKTTATQQKARAEKNKKGQEAPGAASPTPARLAPAKPAPGLERYVIWVAVGLAAIVLICYANSLWDGFVFDDHIHALENPSLRSLANLPHLIFSYRPLRDISYAIDFAIWGESAAGFHLTNILIHAANCVLVFFLIKRLVRPLGMSLVAPALAALIFAIHPLQTDAVTYISGRRDVLFALFYLAAFHFYLSYRANRTVKYLALFLGAWALSIASKEMGASFPILMFTWSFCELWGETSGKWFRKFVTSIKGAFTADRWLYISLAVVGAAYTFYQTYTMGGSERAGYRGFRYWGGSFYHNLLTVVHVHAWFLKQLVWPTPITQYSGAFPVATTVMDKMVIVSIVVVSAVIALGFFLLNRAPLAAFAILSYFVMLLPVSQIIPHHELLADHYLYLPMMSFGLLVALGVERIAAFDERARIAVYATAAIALIVCAVLTIRQNAVWRDDFTLWQANYNAVPNSPRAAYSLGVEYISRNPRKADELFRRCIDLDPAYQNAYTDLVMMAKSREEARGIESLIQNGLAIPDAKIYADEGQYPHDFRSHLTTALAIAKNTEGDHAGAEQLLWKAIRIAPTNQQPYDLLAGYYEKDQAKLQNLLQQEVKNVPFSNNALEHLTILLIKQKKYDDTMPYLRKMLSVNPNDVFANFQLSQIYKLQNDCGRAWNYLKLAQASASRPEDVDDVKKAIPQMEAQCGKQ